MGWLSRLFEMMPMRRRLDLPCSYGAPGASNRGPPKRVKSPSHAVVGGSAVLEDPADGRSLELNVGDILLLPGNPRHVLHDGSGRRRCQRETGRRLR
jgi:AraC family transcriptional activator of mtrCDE